MIRQSDWLMEQAWVLKTGKPPRPFGDYDRTTLQALLFHWDDAQNELEKTIDESDDWEWQWIQEETPMGSVRRKKAVRKMAYDKPDKTGDPVADKWEEAIARGETPDW